MVDGQLTELSNKYGPCDADKTPYSRTVCHSKRHNPANELDVLARAEI